MACSAAQLPSLPPSWVVEKGMRRQRFALEEQEDEDFWGMLSGLFELEPASRTTPTQAFSTCAYLEKGLTLKALVGEAQAGRGLTSFVQGSVGQRTLRRLQTDPCWHTAPPKVGAPKRQKVRHSPSENLLKHEEGGRTRAQAPSTPTCNLIDCSMPCPAQRVGAFVRDWVDCNRKWLVQLTTEVRSELPRRPQELRGGNGERAMKACFSENAFAYAIAQWIKPGERLDPARYDGGASLLHGGQTIFGKRGLEMQAEDDSASSGVTGAAAASAAATATEAVADSAADSTTDADGDRLPWRRTLWQEPGHFYIGNLCAVWPRARHLDAAKSQPLFQSGDGGPGIHSAVMLRTNVFS